MTDEPHIEDTGFWSPPRFFVFVATLVVVGAGIFGATQASSIHSEQQAFDALLDRCWSIRWTRYERELYGEPAWMRDNGGQWFRDNFTDRYTALHLCHPALADDDLRHLADFPCLECLTLSSGNVTDDGLEHLLEVPRLTTLYLDGTSVTARAVDRLRELRPQLVVNVSDRKLRVLPCPENLAKQFDWDVMVVDVTDPQSPTTLEYQ